MYYKVIKNNKVVDVLDRLIYLKWQEKHKRMLTCKGHEAQAILGSDGNTLWHERELLNLPSDSLVLDTVDIVEIDKYEYDQLKALNGKTPEEIIDSFMLSLIEDGVI